MGRPVDGQQHPWLVDKPIQSPIPREGVDKLIEVNHLATPSKTGRVSDRAHIFTFICLNLIASSELGVWEDGPQKYLLIPWILQMHG